MSEVIRFLEAQGRNPARSSAEFNAAVARLTVDDAQRAALLGRNHQRLNELLGGRAQIRCAIALPDLS